MTFRKTPRGSARWKRIRANIGECSADIDPDVHADHIYDTVMSRGRWNVDEELSAELHDTVDQERAKSRGRDGKRGQVAS